MAIVSSDGSVVPITTRSDPASPGLQYSPANETNTSFAVDTATVPADPAQQAATIYLLGDQVGSTQFEVASGGWPVYQGELSAWGQEQPTPEVDTQWTKFGGPYNGQQSAPESFKFTGKERDTESGLDYFGARYYASTMGRFMSPDWSAKVVPVPYAKLDNPQSLNLYAYVANNPLSRIDPDGHYICNGSKDQCAQIQTALNLAKAAVKDLGADSKQGQAIQKVIDLYGDAGKKNGVNVSFASMKPGQLGDAGVGKDGSINIRFDLKQINAFGSNSQQPGASMFGERLQTVVHEGTHGVDERKWGRNPQTPQQEDWTEHNAYRNGSYAVTGLGWFSADGAYSPGMSAKDREAAIDVEAQRSDDAWAGKP